MPRTVQNGLCYRAPPIERINAAIVVNDLRITPLTVPAAALPGESHQVVVTVKNMTQARRSVAFHTKHPDTWEVVASNFGTLDALDLEAGYEVALEATMRAVRADVFEGGVMLSLYLDDASYDVYSTVAFPPDGNVPCGGHFFPPAWCADPGNCSNGYTYYTTGVCCADVFYPGS